MRTNSNRYIRRYTICVKEEYFHLGMGRRDRIPIRIEPGLFECPHYKSQDRR